MNKDWRYVSIEFSNDKDGLFAGLLLARLLNVRLGQRDFEVLMEYPDRRSEGYVVAATVVKQCNEERTSDVHIYYKGELKQHQILSLEELLNADALGHEEPIMVELNKEHRAVVTKEGVQVGCQRFTFDAIKKLADAVGRKESEK